MRMFKPFILFLPVIFGSYVFAAEEAPTKRAERPQREAVKLSPSVRQSEPRPEDGGKMKRVAPPRAESPLQNVPALMPPDAKSPTNP